MTKADLKHRKALALYLTALVVLASISIPLTSVYADCVSYSSTANRIRITCDTTFSHVASHITDPAVLENVGNGEYILKANLQIDDGKRLTISSADVSWLKIIGSYGIIIYGYLDMDGVKVTSWDPAANSVIDNSGSAPRAYIQWRAGDGGLIQNSEFAYLGFQCSGTCTFKRGISMETYGGLGTHDVTMLNNNFHHNYYAYYSNAAYNIVLDGNEFTANHLYDIDPHTATHDMKITNNHIHDSGRYGIICSLDCYNILIEGNKVHDMTNTGIFFSRNMHDSIASNNEIWNVPTGMMFSESPDNEAYGNNIHDVTRAIYFSNPPTPDDGVTQNNDAHDNTITNARYAILSVRSPANTVSNNSIGTASSYEYYLDYASGLTIQNQDFTNDRIRGSNGANSIKIQNSDTIAVGGSSYDTNASPYEQTLTAQTITVNTGSPAPVDATRPAVRITSPTEGQTLANGTIPVSGTSSDETSGVKTVQVRVDSGPYQTATPSTPGDWSTWSIDLNIEALGSHRIQARATDNAGNQNWHSVNVNIVNTAPEPVPADTTRPTIKITSPAESTTFPAGDVPVQGTAGDEGSGLKQIQVKVDAGAYQMATPKADGDWSEWSISLTITTSGTHRILARATDNAGNQAWDDVNIATE